MAELDIFTDTTADDTVTYDYGAGTITNPLQSIGVEDFQNYYADSDISLGEDGLYYNADGERVYRFNPARELGDVGKGSGTWDKDPTTGMTYHYGAVSGDKGIQTWVTESELREMWDAKQGMGYTKQQFDSFDQYMAYVNEVDTLVNSPEYREAEQRAQQIAYLGVANGLRPDEVQAQIDAELGDVLGGFQQQWQGIRNNYGVADVYQNEDGDIFKWNGYAYVKTYKTPQAGFSDYLKMAAVIGAGYLLGGPLANALGGGTLGAAGASGIINAAQQLVLTGKVSWEDALMQAAQAGLTTTAWNALKNSGKMQEIADWVSGWGSGETTTIRDAAGNVLTAAEIDALGGESFIANVMTGMAEGYTGEITGWTLNAPEWLTDAIVNSSGVIGDVVSIVTGEGTGNDIKETGSAVFGGGFPQPGDTTPPPEDQPPPEEEKQKQEQQVEDNVDEIVDPGNTEDPNAKNDNQEVGFGGPQDSTTTGTNVEDNVDEIIDPGTGNVGGTGGSTGPDPVGKTEDNVDELVDPGIPDLGTPTTPTSSGGGSSSSSGMLAGNQFNPFRAGITYAPTLPSPLQVAAPKDFVTPLLTPKKYQGSVKSLFQDYLA